MKFKYKKLRSSEEHSTGSSRSCSFSSEDDDNYSNDIKCRHTWQFDILFINLIFSVSGHRTWCKLAYWEEGDRVGKLHPVSASAVEVFSELPVRSFGDDGLCLASLFKQNSKPSQKTTKTREKIGQGKTKQYSLSTCESETICQVSL